MSLLTSSAMTLVTHLAKSRYHRSFFVVKAETWPLAGNGVGSIQWSWAGLCLAMCAEHFGGLLHP